MLPKEFVIKKLLAEKLESYGGDLSGSSDIDYCYCLLYADGDGNERLFIQPTRKISHLFYLIDFSQNKGDRDDVRRSKKELDKIKYKLKEKEKYFESKQVDSIKKETVLLRIAVNLNDEDDINKLRKELDEVRFELKEEIKNFESRQVDLIKKETVPPIESVTSKAAVVGAGAGLVGAAAAVGSYINSFPNPNPNPKGLISINVEVILFGKLPSKVPLIKNYDGKTTGNYWECIVRIFNLSNQNIKLYEIKKTIFRLDQETLLYSEAESVNFDLEAKSSSDYTRYLGLWGDIGKGEVGRAKFSIRGINKEGVMVSEESTFFSLWNDRKIKTFFAAEAFSGKKMDIS